MADCGGPANWADCEKDPSRLQIADCEIRLQIAAVLTEADFRLQIVWVGGRFLCKPPKQIAGGPPPNNLLVRLQIVGRWFRSDFCRRLRTQITDILADFR